MSVRFQSTGASKYGLPEETGASFDRDAEEQGQGLFAKQLAYINDILVPNGVCLHRIDLRFLRPDMQTRVAAFDGKGSQLLDMIAKEYALPYQALQGLTISSKQDFAVKGNDDADPKLGLFGRTKDGGCLATTGVGFGTFPKVDAVRNSNHPDMYRQPYRRIHSNASSDGVTTNEFLTMFAGSCTFYAKLGKKPPCQGIFKGVLGQEGEAGKDATPDGFVKLDLNCDASTGWRVVYRGEVPHGLRVKEGMKFAWQVIGPQEWKPTFLASDPWTDYSLYGKLPDADTDVNALPEAGRAPLQDVPEE